jgi:hypothetical protein
MMLFSLVGLGACTTRNRDVCCATVDECASIGIAADQVDEFSQCDDGRVCLDLHCVVGSDAASDAMQADAGPQGRCDPTAAFTTPVEVPNINSADQELSFSMTDNELLAFITSDNGTITRLLTATRASSDDDLSIPATDAKLAAIVAGVGTESDLWPADSGRLLYFRRQGQVQVATRATIDDEFSAGSPVLVDGAALPTDFKQVAADGQVLYSVDPNDGFKLYAATRDGGPDAFGPSVVVSLVGMISPIVSSDGLRVYYVPAIGGDDIVQSTRGATSVPFDAGSVIPALGAAQNEAPYFVTADDCLLYFRDSGNIWVSRRGS